MHPLARSIALALCAAAPALCRAQPAQAAPPATAAAPAQAALAWEALAGRVARDATAFLLRAQDPATGGWNVPPRGSQTPHLPAFTGLALNALLMEPGGPSDPDAADRAARFLLSLQGPDGGIHAGTLPTYNTAIAASALSRLGTAQASAAADRAVDFLRAAQWGAALGQGASPAGGPEAPTPVPKEHPFFGGIGYGNRGRPDISNLAFFLQAMHDTGVPADDPAFVSALGFLARLQMLERAPDGTPVNPMPYAIGSAQGGFIYATGPGPQSPAEGQSFAGQIDETLSDGSVASRLRAYGSVSYAGFKSLIYAGLTADDPRVHAVLGWAREHYTLAENPGIGADGYYYYLLMFARAMHASGSPTLDAARPEPLLTGAYWLPAGSADAQPTVLRAATPQAAAALLALGSISIDGRPGTLSQVPPDFTPGPRDWRRDLTAALAALQNPDGSFRSLDDRWLENNPVLVTSYALLALQHARASAALARPQPPADAHAAPGPAQP